MSALHDSPESAAASLAPQAALRTVLLADLGPVGPDMPQAARDADVRERLIACGGRLIDQAEGWLALFERAVQAVDFALQVQSRWPQARVGLHVGEVVTWSNPPEAVRRGAKPLEVEGLAKPVAARLLGLALPGQILLSGLAQSLARQAQAELGGNTSAVRWRSYGRYRFKGVATALVVHEVGLRGRAPLQAPPSSEKAWREIPLWRRPPVLALELLGTAALVVGVGYGLLHTEPALSFGARDWVVVGDFRNLTGDRPLGEALDTALRVSLEQSRYVNLLPELKVESALARMQRPATTPVDRAVGSEVALREGARAVLLPSVTRDGERWRVNVEVVDPSNGVTVYAESAEGTGAASTLASLDRVNAALRARLGEALPDIAANGEPLAKVTTNDLAALEAYADAIRLRSESRYADALRRAQEAVRLDPNFALAYVEIWRDLGSAGEDAAATAALSKAVALRDRMSQREQLAIDAAAARNESPLQAMATLKLLATLYPDEYRAYQSYATLAWDGAQRYDDGADFLSGALDSRSPYRPNAYYLLGVLHLSRDRLADAERAFRRAESLGVRGLKTDYAAVFAARRDFASARATAGLQTRTGAAESDLGEQDIEYLIALDAGHWAQSMALLDDRRERARGVSPFAAQVYDDRAILLKLVAGEPVATVELSAALAAARDDVRSPIAQYRQFGRLAGLALGSFAARAGDMKTAQSAWRMFGRESANSEFGALRSIAVIQLAEIELANGTPKEAVARLQRAQDGTELYLSHASLARALAAAGRPQEALREADWLAAHRGRAYGEWGIVGLLQAANVAASNLAWLDGAEFALAAGDRVGAHRRLTAFAGYWPPGQRPPAMSSRVRRLERALAVDPAGALAARSVAER